MYVTDTKVKPGKRDQTIIEANIAESLANNIVETCGFQLTMKSKLKKTLFNNLILAKSLPIRINTLLGLLGRYGYSEEEALDIIEENNSILLKDSKDLMHSLAIANQYGFSKRILLNNSIVNYINSNLLYALTEELKSRGTEVNEINISRLNRQMMNENRIKEILEKYPLTNKKVFVLSFMYEKDLKNAESRLVLKK